MPLRTGNLIFDWLSVQENQKSLSYTPLHLNEFRLLYENQTFFSYTTGNGCISSFSEGLLFASILLEVSFLQSLLRSSPKIFGKDNNYEVLIELTILVLQDFFGLLLVVL